MARINIEDSLYKTDEYAQLLIITKSKWTAIGMLVCAWTLAQNFYLKQENEGCIPFDEWEKSKLDILIDVGFAVKKEKGVYLRGSEEQFAWLKQRSTAGKISKKSDVTTVNDRPTTVNDRPTTVNGSDPLPLTLTLTHSLKNNINTNAHFRENARKFDFDALYQKYPKKLGKKRGLDICSRQIKIRDDYELLKTAIENYKKHCEANETEFRFIKQFDTFMGSWRDWLDPDVGQVVGIGKKESIYDRIRKKEGLV